MRDFFQAWIRLGWTSYLLALTLACFQIAKGFDVRPQKESLVNYSWDKIHAGL